MHPLGTDLSKLKDDELQTKYSDLLKKFNQACRFGPQAIIPQLQMFMEDYQAEISRRDRKTMDDMMNKTNKDGKGFKGIIDIS